MDLETYLRCPKCRGSVELTKASVDCACGQSWQVRDGIPRFVQADTHENFGIQWNMFADVQLDSVNGTDASRSRLFKQSGLEPRDFAGKKVLEIGSGAGRFTEILVDLGAEVISSDFSAAVDANARSNAAAIERGQLSIVQADVFALPFKEQAFDIVLGYGMLQHTGDPKRALRSLWQHVRPGGLLLVDQYQLSLRNIMPMKYLLRPVTRRLPPRAVLGFSRGVCRAFLPLQRAILRRMQGGGIKKAVRLVVNRSVNSVYPINLEMAGNLDRDTATKWSVLDTFDQFAPRYDRPCTRRQWRRQLAELTDGEIDYAVDCGQGNAGVVRRRAA